MHGHPHQAGLALPDTVASHKSAYSGHIKVLGKPVRIHITRAALRALSRHGHPVIAEMELYFSCLIRKQVLFSEFTGPAAPSEDCTRVLPGLYASFRAVTTKHCRIADTDGKPPVEAMPIREPRRFVPDWLRIDFRRGKWKGEYGFSRNP